jgi:hypothetical protein
VSHTPLLWTLNNGLVNRAMPGCHICCPHTERTAYFLNTPTRCCTSGKQLPACLPFAATRTIAMRASGSCTQALVAGTSAATRGPTRSSLSIRWAAALVAAALEDGIRKRPIRFRPGWEIEQLGTAVAGRAGLQPFLHACFLPLLGTKRGHSCLTFGAVWLLLCRCLRA